MLGMSVRWGLYGQNEYEYLRRNAPKEALARIERWRRTVSLVPVTLRRTDNADAEYTRFVLGNMIAGVSEPYVVWPDGRAPARE